MPGGDGFSVLREARALVPQTAVILLTAFASVPEAVSAMKDGAYEYLVKPVSFEQLEQAAVRVLARTQPIDEGAPDGFGRALARVVGGA